MEKGQALEGQLTTVLVADDEVHILDLLGSIVEERGHAVIRAASGEQALRATREHGLEGLVCKRLDSVYEPGVRSRAWIKIRNMHSEDVIVGGWLPGKGRLSGLPGAVLVGQRAAGRLRYVGNVGTGWSEAERTHLAALLRAAATDVCPFDPVPRIAAAHWVLPRLVGEVRYSTRTQAGLLRQPSWLRLRPDLAPQDASADLPDDLI
jgi:bifunctional non-homologous end joining protein LigD